MDLTTLDKLISEQDATAFGFPVKVRTVLPDGYMAVVGDSEIVIRRPDGVIVKMPIAEFERLLSENFKTRLTEWWDARLNEDIKGNSGPTRKGPL